MNVSQSIEAALKSRIIAGGTLGGIPEARSRNQDRWDVDLIFARDAGV
jgi:hypothetical protein